MALAPADACHHLHLLGATGSGKSTLLLNLVLGDIASGRGTVVIDPKGALVEDILDRLPEHASDRTVVIDAEDPEPPTLNVLAGTDVHLVVDQVVGIMHRLFESAWGPRTDDILRRVPDPAPASRRQPVPGPEAPRRPPLPSAARGRGEGPGAPGLLALVRRAVGGHARP